MDNFYDKYEFFPLTILESPLEVAQEEIKSIVENWWGDKRIYSDDVDLDKINPPPEITPGGAHFTKILLWEPKNNEGKTALFVNLLDAYNSLIHVWNDKYGKQAITLKLSNDSICDYPHHEINIKTENKEERIIYTHVESKWEFFQIGPIQEFENLDHYKSRKIKDRLNNEIVNAYLSSLGYEIGSDSFYKSHKSGIYFEQLSWKNEKNESTTRAIPNNGFVTKLKDLFS